MGQEGLARTSAELRRCARNAKILPTLSINRDDLAHSEQTVKEWALHALLKANFQHKGEINESQKYLYKLS